MITYSHTSVLLEEAVAALAVQSDGVYVDCTFGRGGHSRQILQNLGPAGRLFAFDQDASFVKPTSGQSEAQTLLADPRFCFIHDNFAALAAQLSAHDCLGKVNGILLDLGVSSPQIDDPERGFSHRHDGPLDMRMDQRQGMTAADWLAQSDEKSLARCLARYGEHPRARQLARAIMRAQQQEPITTTRQLRDIVVRTVPPSATGKSPVGQVFQAIRIAVNDELGVLESVLPQCVQALAPGGRLAVISFHSLEDRLVKTFIQRESAGNDWVPGMSVSSDNVPATMRQVQRLLRPSTEEINQNPRARSARLRIGERLA